MILFFYDIEDDMDWCDELLRINNKLHNQQICQYYHDNPDIKKTAQDKWYNKSGAEYHREYYRNNIESRREYDRKRYEKNKKL